MRAYLGLCFGTMQDWARIKAFLNRVWIPRSHTTLKPCPWSRSQMPQFSQKRLVIDLPHSFIISQAPVCISEQITWEALTWWSRSSCKGDRQWSHSSRGNKWIKKRYGLEMEWLGCYVTWDGTVREGISRGHIWAETRMKCGKPYISVCRAWSLWSLCTCSSLFLKCFFSQDPCGFLPLHL